MFTLAHTGRQTDTECYAGDLSGGDERGQELSDVVRKLYFEWKKTKTRCVEGVNRGESIFEDYRAKTFNEKSKDEK